MTRSRVVPIIAALAAPIIGVMGAPVVTGQMLPWQIGVVCPLTTSSRSFGIGHLQGVTLAFDQLKGQASIPIELQIVDDQADPDMGRDAVRRLIDRGAIAVLGPCNSSVARKILEQQPPLPIPMVSSLTTATELTKTEHPYFFRANVSDEKRMAALLYKVFSGKTPDNLVMLYEENDSYGMGLRDDAKRWLKDNQPQFRKTKERSYQRDLGEKGAIALVDGLRNEFGDANDVWLLLGLASDGRSIVTAVRRKHLDVQLYLPGPEPELFQSLAREGVDVAGVNFISVWDETDQSIDKATLDFKNSFSIKFNGHASSGANTDDGATYDAALGYDGAKALFWAVQQALATDAARQHNIQEVREEIRKKLNEYKPAEHVLNGDERFDHGEYAQLKFVGLKFDHEGRSLRMEQEIPPRKANAPDGAVQIVLPPGSVLLLVGTAGLLGSITRKIYNAPGNLDTKARLWNLVQMEVLVADPLISVIVFITLFLALLVFRPSFGAMLTDQPAAVRYAGLVVGFLAGYLGVRALHVTLEKIGVTKDTFKDSAPAPPPPVSTV